MLRTSSYFTIPKLLHGPHKTISELLLRQLPHHTYLRAVAIVAKLNRAALRRESVSAKFAAIRGLARAKLRLTKCLTQQLFNDFEIPARHANDDSILILGVAPRATNRRQSGRVDKLSSTGNRLKQNEPARIAPACLEVHLVMTRTTTEQCDADHNQGCKNSHTFVFTKFVGTVGAAVEAGVGSFRKFEHVRACSRTGTAVPLQSTITRRAAADRNRV